MSARPIINGIHGVFVGVFAVIPQAAGADHGVIRASRLIVGNRPGLARFYIAAPPIIEKGGLRKETWLY